MNIPVTGKNTGVLYTCNLVKVQGLQSWTKRLRQFFSLNKINVHCAYIWAPPSLPLGPLCSVTTVHFQYKPTNLKKAFRIVGMNTSNKSSEFCKIFPQNAGNGISAKTTVDY